MNIHNCLIFIIIASATNLFSVSSVNPAYRNSPTAMCGILSEVVVRKLVKSELPHVDPAFSFIRAGNDIGCGKTEHMANIAILAPEKPGKYYYSIFHVHFDEGGNIISLAAFFPWKILKDINDPSVWLDWCDIIRSVYPNEIKAQGCS